MRGLVVGFALLLLAACAGMPPGAPPLSREQLAQVQARLYALIVEERMKLNAEAKPLRLDAELTAAAQAHSDDMAKRRAFDPSNDAARNIAVHRLAANPDFQGYVGENSAMQYFTPGAPLDPDAVARTFVDLWLKSPEHRDHIGFAGFDRTGVGIAANDNEIFAAQIFVTDFGLPARAP
jgi:uncharacterized protein YkwD